MARFALHALLVVCVLTSGCSLFGPDYTREDRAVEALENATSTHSATDTYRFESHMTVTSAADGRTERVDIALTGTVDVAARTLRQEAIRDSESRRTFVVNRTVYRECAPPWDGWAVEESDDTVQWVNRTPAVRQLSLLESGSLYWNGTETVDGDRAVVLTGEPSSDALTEYQDDQSRPLFGGPRIDGVELRAWIDADTKRLLRTELRFTVSNRDNSATATMETTFSDYGESVSIDVPSEARTNQYNLGCPGE
ncbi:hypothetical protein ACFQJ5_13810 [Halomicroarcula sp. GCM10025324]|uniref:hypothetical protein n=1 Tax=Haloarcula TaxID=2237 RepID=UPI0023E7B474|nr:hypothetical protein [Halomicroarcula sp. ZS-22-S1]